MTGTPYLFGTTPQGADVPGVDLAAGRLRAKVMGWGACLNDLTVEMPGGPRRVVLGFDRLEDYIAHSPYFGATAGRYGGRIAGGRLVIDGSEYRLPINEKGGCHLHGGPGALGKRPWELVEADAASALFRITSPDGDNGYPGNLTATCRYTLADDAVQVELTATSDAPTAVNLLHHSYFNLDGGGTTDDHRLRIDAQDYVEADEFILPTGRIMPVAGTDKDFRVARPVGDTPYDMSFVIAGEARAAPHPQGMLTGASGDLSLDVSSTEPGLHIYNGFKLAIPVPGLGGARYGPRSGLCLEPHRMADAPNQPGFPDTILRPGQTYRQITEYRFR